MASGRTSKEGMQEKTQWQGKTVPFYQPQWLNWYFLGLAAGTGGLGLLGWALGVTAVWVQEWVSGLPPQGKWPAAAARLLCFASARGGMFESSRTWGRRYLTPGVYR